MVGNHRAATRYQSVKNLLPAVQNCGDSNQDKITKQRWHKEHTAVSVTTIILRWDYLIAVKQAQSSHWIRFMMNFMSYNKFQARNDRHFIESRSAK